MDGSVDSRVSIIVDASLGGREKERGWGDPATLNGGGKGCTSVYTYIGAYIATSGEAK